MRGEFVWRLGRPMRLDVAGAGEQLAVNGTDAPCDQVGVLQIAHSYRTVVPFSDEIDEAIAVAGLDMKLGVTSRQLRDHRRKMCQAERHRHGDSQAAMQLAGGHDRFPGDIDFSAGPGRMVPENRPGLGKRRPACGSRKQLDAKLRFQAQQPTADDRFGNA